MLDVTPLNSIIAELEVLKSYCNIMELNGLSMHINKIITQTKNYASDLKGIQTPDKKQSS